MPINGSNFISAEAGFQNSEKAVQYMDESGRIEIRQGGSRAWRNSNPGNIIFGAYANDHGAIGRDKDGFAIFPDWETGYKAHEALLRKRSYLDLAIEEAVKRYTDGDSPETQEGYVNYITTQTGMLRTKKISDMSEEEYQDFIRVMREFEDSTPGRSFTDFGDGMYYEQDYLQIYKGSPKDFSNYGPNIPQRYEGVIEFTPDGKFRTGSRIPVESSNVKDIGYDEETHTLPVGFQSGSVYEYSDVPVPVFERFIDAPSKGKFLHREIKGVYDYSRVD